MTEHKPLSSGEVKSWLSEVGSSTMEQLITKVDFQLSHNWLVVLAEEILFRSGFQEVRVVGGGWRTSCQSGQPSHAI